MINLVDFFKALINTLVRLSPVAFYSGSLISGALFSDFRAILLLGGFVLNEFISLGYRMIFRGIPNPQCALLMSSTNEAFILPSPITQTMGFLTGFIFADMYYTDNYQVFKFFVMAVLLILTIYSRVNVGCKTLLDGIYCALIGIVMGIIYYSLIKDMYRSDYLRLDDKTGKVDQALSDFFKL